MKNKKSNSLFENGMIKDSIKQAAKKLDPRTMIKNPVMFLVEICTAIMAVVTIFSVAINGSAVLGHFGYNLTVFIVLLITLLFANFAESIAEARGKAQADSLRKTREDTPARVVSGNSEKIISSALLKLGDELHWSREQAILLLSTSGLHL